MPNNALVFAALFIAPSSDAPGVIWWVRREIGKRLLNGATVDGSFMVTTPPLSRQGAWGQRPAGLDRQSLTHAVLLEPLPLLHLQLALE